MNTKNLATLIAVLGFVALAVGAGILFLNYRNTVLENKQGQPGHEQQGAVAIQDKKITDQTNPLNIDITYPYVEGLDEFNQKIKSYLDGQAEEFKKNSLENDAAVKKIDPESYAKYPRKYDMVVSYEKGQVDENLISVVFNIYKFEGGAHGATIFYAVNYSPKDKKEIKLADVFSGQSDYLKKISDYCINDLTKQIEKLAGTTEGSWINEGAGPAEENFSVFLITNDNIVFYFPQYQVAPYALGEFKVAMSQPG